MSVWAGIAQAAGSLIGTGLGMIENDKNRKAEQSRFDRMLEYNLPINQRKRLEAAGFNPNLVYGNGLQGNVAPSMSPPSQQAPKSDLGSLVYDMLQYQNLEKQNENLEAENARIKAATEGMRIRNEADELFLHGDRSWKQENLEWDAQLKKNNFDSITEANQERARQAALLTQKMIIESNYWDDMQKGKLSEVAARIASLQGSAKVSDMTAALQAADLELRKVGLSMSDPAILRMLSKLLPEGFDLQKFFNKNK